MNREFEELVERIRGESSDLDRLVQRMLSAWNRSKSISKEQDVYLESVALNLHGFYSGLERLFELIARRVDQNLPSGDTWHRDLLNQMAQDVRELRPAVISPERISSLDELRRFRHLVRNVYTFNLVPDKIEPLITALPALWPQVRAELLAFADFLSDLARANNT
jgi:hypothetical protein